MESLEKFKTIAHEFVRDTPINLIHDADPDGYAAAALICKVADVKTRTTLLRNGRCPSYDNNYPVVCVDYPLERFDNLPRDRPVLVIDHHPVTVSVPDNFILIKPHLFQNKIPDQRYPAARLIFDLFDGLPLWIAEVGVVGDFATDFFSVPNYDVLFKLGNYLHYASYDGKHDLAVDVLLLSSSPVEAMQNLSRYDKMDEEIENYCSSVVVDDLSYSFIDLRKNVTSVISNRLSVENPHKTYFLCFRHDGVVRVSARRNDGAINLGNLLLDAAKNFEGVNAGGHICAAGASVPQELFDTFKNKLIELHEAYTNGR